MSTLVTFLGRVPHDEKGKYRRTVYRFDDGTSSEPVAFLGWELRKRVRADRLVILGTSGSMWDHLFEGDLDLGSIAEDERTGLMDAVAAKAVTPGQLEPLAGLLAAQLDCEVVLELIPYCRTDEEQVDLLGIMARHIEPGGTAHIDITHGFRHLPMLGLLSALHLQRARSVRVEGIWYGVYDPDTGAGSVHGLTGLLHIAAWLSALAVYENSSDYSVFAPLVDAQIGELLEEASFLESVNRIGQARSRVRKALGLIRDNPPVDPAWLLFREELERRLSWSSGNDSYDRQRQLAAEFLDRGRYRDAALNAYEAFITRLVRQRGFDPEDGMQRAQARDDFDATEKARSPRRSVYREWDTLRRLRNALAHGGQPQGDEVQRALGSRQAMESLLRKLFDSLLTVNGP